jgi:cephalosporin hydroxylase
MDSFTKEVLARIQQNSTDAELRNATDTFTRRSSDLKYSYNFRWLDRPVIQYPQDMVAVQELIWSVRPDLVIETGIAHGGSLVLSASMLALLDLTDAIAEGRQMDPRVSSRRVLGIDIDIRAHNRAAIEAHPMASRIEMIEGSSIAPEIIYRVHAFAKNYKRIMVCLDSNHTHAHVLEELNAYASLTSKGSYCIVFDTVIEDMPKDAFPDRPWGPGDNPKTAVWEFLKSHPEFEIDNMIHDKLQITVAPDGYLRRTA